MTRKFTFLILALFALISGPGWGQTIFTPSDYSGQGGESGTGGTASATKDGITIASTKAYVDGETAVREYKGGTLTISSSNSIVSISITATSGSYAKFAANTGTISTSGAVQTWSGAANSIIFTASAQCRWNKIEITTSTPSTDPVINAEDVELDYDATSGEISYSITNSTEGQSLTAELTEGDWISNLAVDAENNQVTFNATVNTGAARTATVRLKYTGATDKIVTVTQKKFAVDYATLPFEWDGGTSSDFTELDGVTTNGLGSDYAESHAPYLIKFDNTGDYIQIKTNEAIGTITIGVKMIGGASASSITIKGSADGEEFTDVETLYISGNQNTELTLTTTNIFDASYRYVRMVFTKGSNVGVGPITIAKATVVYTVSIATDITNGSITVNLSTAIAGSTITITPNPAVGYKLGQYTISKTEDGSDVTANVSLDGNTFTMPDYNVTVSATFEEADKYAVNIAEGITHGEVFSVEDEYYEGATVQLTVEPATNYRLASWSITKSADESVTEIVPVYNSEDETYEFTMPAYDITVSATFEQVVTYTRINNIDDLIAGKHYIIVGENEGTYYAMDSQNENNRTAIEIEVTEAKVQVLASTSMQEFTISGDLTNNYTFYDLAAPGFLYAASSSKNYLKTEETLEDNGKWTIEIDEEIDEATGEATGEATIIAQGDNSRNMMRFNSTSELFSCYSSGQQPVYLYMKENDIDNNIYSDTYIDGDLEITTSYGVNKDAILMVTGNLTNTNPANLVIEDGGQLIHHNAGVQATMRKEVTAYSTTEGVNNGWYFVTSPMAALTSHNLNNGTFDLYKFEQSADKEWKNYESTAFSITNKEGYLYANAENTTIEFVGTLNATDGSKTLAYENVRLAGFNLIGNPFACNANIGTQDFYICNGENIILAENSTIAPCTGIMVKANTTGESVTFVKGEETTRATNAMDITIAKATRNANTIDRARINFSGDSQLSKFFFNENSCLYIPQNGEDFAVVAAQNEGEMPVNFKAEKNGTYTITVNTENVDAEYLHLIDNMTGMDTDLLSTPSYTFNATTRDYASRFKLVFSMNDVESNQVEASSFAYISNGEIVISNEGRATLQVIDVMGRIISSEEINGECRISTNGLTAGVYVLNLNGNVQKIVVR